MRVATNNLNERGLLIEYLVIDTICIWYSKALFATLRYKSFAWVFYIIIE